MQDEADQVDPFIRCLDCQLSIPPGQLYCVLAHLAAADQITPRLIAVLTLKHQRKHFPRLVH